MAHTKHFFTYFSRHGVPTLSRNEEAIRTIILDFKKGEDYAQHYVRHLVVEYLRNNYTEDELAEIYFTPVPASTMDRSCDRWCIFSHYVCHGLGMKNGYHIWCNSEDITPTHITRMENGDDGVRPKNYFFRTYDDDVVLEGKKAIIFDDIKSTGKTIEQFKAALEEEGMEVIDIITLALA